MQHVGAGRCRTGHPGTVGAGRQEDDPEAGFTRFAVRDFGNPLNAFYEVRP
jgi:hypothetical protein